MLKHRKIKRKDGVDMSRISLKRINVQNKLIYDFDKFTVPAITRLENSRAPCRDASEGCRTHSPMCP